MDKSRDLLARVMIVLVEHGVTPDILDLLEKGHPGPSNAVKPFAMRAALQSVTAENERLREAINFAIESIDCDDIISAWERLSAALGEEK